MASNAHHPNGHLDATTDREVVFCHACSAEWYRDVNGLQCPSCHSEVTEVVEPDNDPRGLSHHSSASTSPEPGHLHEEDDPDIEDDPTFREYFGPDGFHYHHNVRDHPDHEHHNPSVDPVLERFIDMLQGFRPPGQDANRPGPPTRDYSGGRIQRTRTFTSGGPFGGGRTSITIVSGPIVTSRVQTTTNFRDPSRGAGLARGDPDPFQAIFSNIVRDIGPPGDDNGDGPEGAGGRPAAGFARSLHDILSLFTPDHAVAGDAVYTQEALDRIITGLMEANPQSNAAPPATEEGLQKLTRKEIDKEMLGPEGNTECTICIDEMKVGETAIYLPCKHWFHEDCVVLWLKEHNTCPICRTPIEKNDGPSRNNRNNNDDGPSQRQGEGPFNARVNATVFPARFDPNPGPAANSSNHPWLSMSGIRRNADVPPTDQYIPTGPPPASSLFRTPFDEEATHQWQALAGQDASRNGEWGSTWNDRGTTSETRYDTSRLQRRSSHSPTSPRVLGPEEHGARMRQRSPSRSQNREREQRRPSGLGGPFSWIRRLGSGGGSGNGSSRDERRQ